MTKALSSPDQALPCHLWTRPLLVNPAGIGGQSHTARDTLEETRTCDEVWALDPQAPVKPSSHRVHFRQ